MGIVAIACYKPKKGRHNLLKRIIKGHSKILLREKLITEAGDSACNEKRHHHGNFRMEVG